MKAKDEIRKNIVAVFEELDPSIKDAVSNLKGPMLQSFAVLALTESNTEYISLSAYTIAAALVEAGVSLSAEQITNALKKAGAQVHRTQSDGETYYRLMTDGRKRVEKFLESGPIRVMQIEAGKPITARKVLKQLLSDLSGKIRVCDPYYGVKSLDSLLLIPKTCNVQFMTGYMGNKEDKAQLGREIKDFQTERSKTELKKYAHPVELHDRFVMSDDTLLILGHGIKDIGNKESFAIVISAEHAQDLIGGVKRVFDKRWKNSTTL